MTQKYAVQYYPRHDRFSMKRTICALCVDSFGLISDFMWVVPILNIGHIELC
jgi:hypothetical protein